MKAWSVAVTVQTERGTMLFTALIVGKTRDDAIQQAIGRAFRQMTEIDGDQPTAVRCIPITATAEVGRDLLQAALDDVTESA